MHTKLCTISTVQVDEAPVQCSHYIIFSLLFCSFVPDVLSPVFNEVGLEKSTWSMKVNRRHLFTIRGHQRLGHAMVACSIAVVVQVAGYFLEEPKPSPVPAVVKE